MTVRDEAGKLKEKTWSAETFSLKQRDPNKFVEALTEAGITLAVVSEDEAYRSHRQAEFAKEIGSFAPRYNAGEIVAVTEPSLAYGKDGKLQEPRVSRLDKRTTGDDRTAVQRFLKPIDRRELKSIDATKDLIKAKAETRITEMQDARQLIREMAIDARMERAGIIYRGKPVRTTIRRGLHSLARDGASGVHKAGSPRSLHIIGKTLDNISDGFQSLFSPTLTPEQKIDNEVARQTREADAQHTIDVNAYIGQRAIESRQQQHEHEADRERERGRDRR